MKTYQHQPSGTVPRARRLRRDSTDAERALWRALREAFPDRKWRRQMPIGPYFVDFACFAERLIVEADGVIEAIAATLSSPLVGEDQGGGRAASAADKNPGPPNPVRMGERMPEGTPA